MKAQSSEMRGIYANATYAGLDQDRERLFSSRRDGARHQRKNKRRGVAATPGTVVCVCLLLGYHLGADLPAIK